MNEDQVIIPTRYSKNHKITQHIIRICFQRLTKTFKNIYEAAYYEKETFEKETFWKL